MIAKRILNELERNAHPSSRLMDKIRHSHPRVRFPVWELNCFESKSKQLIATLVENEQNKKEKEREGERERDREVERDGEKERERD